MIKKKKKRKKEKKLFAELEDKPRWEETKSGDFSAKSMYKVLEDDPSFAFPSVSVSV